MLEHNKVYLTDCLGKKGFKALDDNSIHLLVTSPPYFNAKAYSYWDTYQDYLHFIRQVFTEAFRTLKEGRMCVVNISPILIPRESRNSESRRLNLPAHFSVIMEKIGFKFIEDIQWVKPDGSAKNRNGGFYRHRQPVAYKPNIINEYIYVFQKPFKSGGLIDKVTRSYKGDLKEKSLVNEEYERTNVWYMNPVTNSSHLAPYPKELSDKVIKYYSYVGDLVLDPFMGSGTTALSCIDLERNYIGFEYQEEYFNLINKNIKGF